MISRISGALKGCAHFWLHRVHQILDCFCDDSSKNDMFVRTEKQSSTVRDNSVRCFYDINLHAINIRVRRARDFEFSRWTSNNSMCWVSNQDLCWLLKCMSLKIPYDPASVPDYDLKDFYDGLE